MSRGGGVLIALTNKFTCNQTKTYQSKYVDSCWVEINMVSGKWWLGVVYISPNAPNSEYSSLFNFVTTIINPGLHPNHHLLVTGDFNCPEYSLGIDTKNSRELNLFSNFLQLKQFNKVLNSNGRILDLIFSTADPNVSSCIEPLVPIDNYHPALTIELHIRAPRTKPIVNCVDPPKRYLFSKGNYEMLYALIRDTDFSSVQTADN